MQPSYPSNAADQYLAQRITGASQEQLTVLLLEGGQRFLVQAIQAIQQRDIGAKARLINRVSAIVEELTVRLNHEEGGELVTNLTRIYEWWIHELFEASQGNQAERLERVCRQMGDMKNTWEELAQRRAQTQAPVSINPEGMMG